MTRRVAATLSFRGKATLRLGETRRRGARLPVISLSRGLILELPIASRHMYVCHYISNDFVAQRESRDTIQRNCNNIERFNNFAIVTLY